MFLISTRNYPPDIGGNAKFDGRFNNALLNHGPVQVFADSFEESEKYDQNSKLNIQRISGFKIFKKYRKANLVKDFIKIIIGELYFLDRHWKSIENIDETVLENENFLFNTF